MARNDSMVIHIGEPMVQWQTGSTRWHHDVNLWPFDLKSELPIWMYHEQFFTLIFDKLVVNNHGFR